VRNNGLDAWDTWMFSLSFLLALVASVVRLRESRMGAWNEFRWVHRTIGVLAASYSVGYLSVLFGYVDRLTWSRFFVGVSVFAWMVVWIYPPILARRVAKEIVDKTAEALIQASRL
jgi:hypothetical protein